MWNIQSWLFWHQAETFSKDFLQVLITQSLVRICWGMGKLSPELDWKLNDWALRMVISITTTRSQQVLVYPKDQLWIYYSLTSSLIFWMMGQSVPSASLQMTQNWEKRWYVKGSANQKDQGRLEKWVDKNIIRFNMEKCKVLHLDKTNSRYQEHDKGHPATQQPGRKGSGNLGGHQVEHETAMCPYH